MPCRRARDHGLAEVVRFGGHRPTACSKNNSLPRGSSRSYACSTTSGSLPAPTSGYRPGGGVAAAGGPYRPRVGRWQGNLPTTANGEKTGHFRTEQTGDTCRVRVSKK